MTSSVVMSNCPIRQRTWPRQMLWLMGFILLPGLCAVQAQTPVQTIRDQLDSLFIEEVEDRQSPDKVLHAEPLFIDLIRDLGARKGEREWNLGVGLTDNNRYDTYQALIEYEWAPANRLGLEVELPFTFYRRTDLNTDDALPGDRLDGLKTAIQWSFYVSERHKTTLALGYINEVKLAEPGRWQRGPAVVGNVFNPFLIAARRWGNRFHTLVYTGPRLTRAYGPGTWKQAFEVNTNLHYMIPGTRNFVGLELNKELSPAGFDLVARPQLRVGITDHMLIGIVTGIPLSREQQRLSSFLRLIYEPTGRHRRPLMGAGHPVRR